jgi:hypothetical protein
MPGGGSTIVFETKCKLGEAYDGGPTNGGNDEGWWSSGGGWKDEFDFFEHWGWRGPPSVLADVWVYDTSGPHTVSITDTSAGGMAKWLGADPGTSYHTLYHCHQARQQLGVVGRRPAVWHSRCSTIIRTRVDEVDHQLRHAQSSSF